MSHAGTQPKGVCTRIVTSDLDRATQVRFGGRERELVDLLSREVLEDIGHQRMITAEELRANHQCAPQQAERAFRPTVLRFDGSELIQAICHLEQAVAAE
jgi:hypothetical protein